MNILTIGGSDPSSGAGIQSDIKTFDEFGAYGFTVITAITSQNTSRFKSTEAVSKKMINDQLDSIISDFKIDAIKIGMVYNSDIIKAIYSRLERVRIPIIVDTVIRSTTGGVLLEKNALSDYKKLISLAKIITPNKFEAEMLAKIKINSKADLRDAARRIHQLGAKNVVITGLELEHGKITDYVYDGKNGFFVSGRKIRSINHGSGCNYSAALAVAVAGKQTLSNAVRFAKRFSAKTIQNAEKIGKGVSITKIRSSDIIYQHLESAINEFVEIPQIYKHIPECQTNFVFGKDKPKSLNDFLGVSGRLVRAGKEVLAAGNLEYGGSKHVATAVLAMNKKFAKIRAGINIRYNKNVIEKFRKKGLNVTSYDRKDEPKSIKTSGSSIDWGVKHAIKTLEKPPDVIYHLGDFGKEPMILIFAESPSKIIEKINRVLN